DSSSTQPVNRRIRPSPFSLVRSRQLMLLSRFSNPPAWFVIVPWASRHPRLRQTERSVVPLHSLGRTLWIWRVIRFWRRRLQPEYRRPFFAWYRTPWIECYRI